MRNRNYETILDSLPDTGIYVIREDNHSVLYHNKKIRDMLPDIRIGMSCQEIWAGSCRDCPLADMGNSQESMVVHCSVQNGRHMDITALRVSLDTLGWGDVAIQKDSTGAFGIPEQIPAVVVTIRDCKEGFSSDHDRVEELERRNQEVIRYLGAANFGVYDIDLGDGTVHAIRSAEDIPEIEDFGVMDWQDLLKIKMERYIHPEDGEGFFREFSLDALREMAKEGEKRREIVYQRLLDNRYHYVAATAYLSNYRETDHIILALQNVDERVRREIAYRQDDRRMATIIRSRYNVMNTVYLDTGKCTRFYLERPGEEWSGDYQHFIQKTIEDYVYEEDAELFLSKLSIENLRKQASLVEDFWEETCQYRLKQDKLLWVEQHIFYIRHKSGVAVSILGRDITGEKQREAMDMAASQEKALIINTLSSLFFAAYYIDIEQDTFRRITQRKEVGEILGSEGTYGEAIQLYAARFVHSQDREEYLQVMNPDNLRNTLTAEHPLAAMEYRGNEADESRESRWIRASVILAEWDGEVPRKALYVAQDVTESKLKEEREHKALQEACDAANDANASKSEFLSRMSHDIRTPMNAIVGMTTIAGNHLNDPEKVRDCLNKIAVSSKHLLSLLNEVLDMSKIESGKINLVEEQFSLADMMKNLLTMTRPAVREKCHVLDVRFVGVEHLDVLGDMVRLQQVFVNILSNAIKYTPPGGKLDIEVREKPSDFKEYGCYEFIFKDNGIGMEEEFLKRIFEPFSRAEDSRISKIEGTGLGMAIAQNIVHRMNGQIRVKSQLYKGSCFTVMVFLKQQGNETTGEKGIIELPMLAETGGKDVSFKGYRVLLAEDNELNMEIAKEIIGETGVEVETASDGMEAVERFAARKEGYYDLIFMDLQMPRMNGYEATKAIRAMERADAREIPIIALTANAFTDDRISSHQAGMNEHLSKPLNIEQLIDCMERYLKG